MQHKEHYLQVAIVRYLRLNKIFCFAIPNGGRRDLITGAVLKREGVLAGSPDLVIILPNQIYFVELKNGNQGRQSKEQKAFQETVEKLGFKYLLWREFYDVENFVRMKKNALLLNKNML